MASVYLRPTADNYCTFTKYPEDSLNAYSLIDDVTSDGSSTYIGATVSTADTLYSNSASFILSGVTLPVTEFQITKIKLVLKTSYTNSLGTNKNIVITTVSSNGIKGISDVFTPTSGFLDNDSGNLSDSSFDRDGLFLKMFSEYHREHGKFPDVQVDITSHYTSSKDSNTWYITQLYLEVVYNTGVYVKDYKVPTYTGYIYQWRPSYSIYKKTNGSWYSISNGQTQISSGYNKRGHCLVAFGGKAATCLDTGLISGCKCEECNQIIYDATVIPAKGHTPTTIEASEATCGKDGYTGGEKCSVCGAILSGSIIPATGNHTIKEVAATEPNCVFSGYTAGTQCSTCNTYLSGHERIPATGIHTYETVAASEATCGADGYTGGEKCSVCGNMLSGSVIPATGNHTPVDDNNGVAATDIHDGITSTISCSVCGKLLTDYKVIPRGGNHTCTPTTIYGYAATCVKTGLTDGKRCSVCGKILVAQQVLPIVEHSWIAATCTTPQTCSVCGAIGSEAAKGHTITILPAVSPTCGTTGLTEGQYCTTCATTVVAQQVVSATGNHTYTVVDGVDKCSICGYVPVPEYYGEITSNGASGAQSTATNIGNYALFGCSKDTNMVCAYDTSLTMSSPTSLSQHRYSSAATSVGDYALFGGGYNLDANASYYNTVDTYNSSLTKGNASALSQARSAISATSIGNYALFGGGVTGLTYYNTVDTYNSSLTKGNASALSQARTDIGVTSNGNYALFAGGHQSNGVGKYNVVDAYDTSLTKSNPTSLNAPRSYIAATSVGDYALFGGGYDSEVTAVVEAYNKSLTKILPTALYEPTYQASATTVDNYAIFGGKFNDYSSVYNPSLTRSTATWQGSGKANSATAVGNYALFSNDSSGDTVLAYIIDKHKKGK